MSTQFGGVITNRLPAKSRAVPRNSYHPHPQGNEPQDVKVGEEPSDAPVDWSTLMQISLKALADLFPPTKKNQSFDAAEEILAIQRQYGRGRALAPGQAKRPSPAPQQPQPPAAAPPVDDSASIQPVPTTVTETDYTIDQLAELYVRQYQAGTGVTLSESAFQQRKAEVATFYSGLSDGQHRLDAIVFANDS